MMLVIKKKKIQFAVIPTPPPIHPLLQTSRPPGFKLERSPDQWSLQKPDDVLIQEDDTVERGP